MNCPLAGRFAPDLEFLDLGSTHVTSLTALGEMKGLVSIRLTDAPVDDAGLTGLRELTMGSVAHKVSAAAKCPVMIIR